MEFQTRKLADLKPAEYNPRKALQPGDPEFEDIARSIENLGYVAPIVINTDGTIISGHQRCTVMKHLGYTEAEVAVVELNKEQEKAANIALNKITGQWDKEKLADLLIELDGSELGMEVTGFKPDELSDLIADVIVPEEAVDDGFNEDEVMADISEPRVKRGEIWKLGNHLLMCGDSTDTEQVIKLAGEGEIDLILTDPPYNVNYEEKIEHLNKLGIKTSRQVNHIENDYKTDGQFYKFLYRAFNNMATAARPGAVAYIFHADTETLNFRTAMKAAGFKIAECLIWEKNSFVLGRQDYHWRHEPILYGWKEGAGHYFINDRSQDTVILDDDIDFESMKKQELIAYIEQNIRANRDNTTVIFENKPHKSDIHPTMKPVELVGKFVKNSSRPGWTVLDLFSGSGSTLIACEQLSRKARCMEYDPKYCEAILRRWEDFTGQKAEKIDG